MLFFLYPLSVSEDTYLFGLVYDRTAILPYILFESEDGGIGELILP